MHFNKQFLLAVPALLASSVLAQSPSSANVATIDTNKWYALYSSDNMFLDSDKGVIKVNKKEGGTAAVSTLGDKGKRFKFPSTVPSVYRGMSKIVSQAHPDHQLAAQGGKLIATANSGIADPMGVVTKVVGGQVQIALGTADHYISYSSGSDLSFNSGAVYNQDDGALTFWHVAEVQDA